MHYKNNEWIADIKRIHSSTLQAEIKVLSKDKIRLKRLISDIDENLNNIEENVYVDCLTYTYDEQVRDKKNYQMALKKILEKEKILVNHYNSIQSKIKKTNGTKRLSKKSGR
jgi:hypothetical protein